MKIKHKILLDKYEVDICLVDLKTNTFFINHKPYLAVCGYGAGAWWLSLYDRSSVYEFLTVKTKTIISRSKRRIREEFYYFVISYLREIDEMET